MEQEASAKSMEFPHSQSEESRPFARHSGMPNGLRGRKIGVLDGRTCGKSRGRAKISSTGAVGLVAGGLLSASRNSKNGCKSRPHSHLGPSLGLPACLGRGGKRGISACVNAGVSSYASGIIAINSPGLFRGDHFADAIIRVHRAQRPSDYLPVRCHLRSFGGG